MLQIVAVLLLCSVGEAFSGAPSPGNLTESLAKFHALADKLPEDMSKIQLELGNAKEGDNLLKDATQHANTIREKLKEILDEVNDLRLRVEKLEMEKQKDDEEKNCGTWYLGMNLNPSDGHVMGYETGWSDDSSIGTLEDALIKDYLNQTVWNLPAKYIAIVRHHHGSLDAVKVFAFKHWGLSLSHRFKDTDPGRNVVTEGGPIQEYIAPGAHNLADDPVFSVGGDLAFNWGYSRNGARLVLTGGHLSGADVDDDNTHGFGNNFWVRPKMVEDPEASPAVAHEIANIQDCPYPRCTSVRVQGTDHGSGETLKSGPVYGNYGIYVSNDFLSFPTNGSKIGINMVSCDTEEN